LAGWESTFVVNKAQIGSVRPGQLSSQPDALALFIGFLTEVQARGYRVVNGTGAYSFRCTASTRKDCRGLTRSSLSNHAYGLASDLNTTQNPMQTLYGVNGASACQTPMRTDMPQWVIQVAEKWGLYWGGYGWSGGCSSPDQFKSSASRDPMHFEFNGTVEQARAILCFNLGYAPKHEVVADDGDIEKRCFGSNVPLAGTRIVIHTDAPAGATAAFVNLTGVGANDTGYFTAESCTTDPPKLREWSNGNVRPGRAVAATAVVSLDADGRFCLYNSTAMHSIVDVLGFFAPADSAPNGSLYTPVTPVRTNDTRQRTFCTPANTCFNVGPISTNTEIVNAAVSPVDAVATLANITVVQPASDGFLTADDCTRLPGQSPHSNVNFVRGDVVANLALSPTEGSSDGERFCTFSATSTHELIDVQGFFAPHELGGLGYNPMVPTRLVDTRQCWTDQVTTISQCGKPNTSGQVIELSAPSEAKAVVINITTVGNERNGYVSAGPCSVINTGQAEFSNVNTVLGVAVPNAAVVPVDPDGTFCVYNSNPMHVIVDLMGTFADTGARFMAITPRRVHDSRA
jgi:hypothetical protein